MTRSNGPVVDDVDEGDMQGCGWEYDHTIRPGENICRECGAEIWDEDE